MYASWSRLAWTIFCTGAHCLTVVELHALACESAYISDSSAHVAWQAENTLIAAPPAWLGIVQALGAFGRYAGGISNPAPPSVRATSCVLLAVMYTFCLMLGMRSRQTRLQHLALKVGEVKHALQGIAIRIAAGDLFETVRYALCLMVAAVVVRLASNPTMMHRATS